MGACEGTVERRAALGLELRRARERAGLSQRALGRQVGRDRSSISRIEATGRTDDAAWWRLVDDQIGAGGAVVSAWLVVLGAEQGVALALAEPAQTAVREDLVPPTITADEGVTQVPAASSGAPAPLGDDGCRCAECLARWVKSMNLDRRDATRLFTILLATATSPDGLSRTTRALASGRADPGVIDEIDTVLAACQRQEDKLGPSTVLPAMLAQREMIEDLLRDCLDATRPRLLVAFGRANISLAYYVSDFDDFDRAERYCDEARRAAHEAQDIPLAAYALRCIAFFADRAGKHDVSTDAGVAASRLVQGCDDGRLRACIAEMIAANHAQHGNLRSCMRALDSARKCVDSPVTATSPAYWFSKGRLFSRASRSELRLGHHAQAAASASAGLDLLAPSATGGRAFGLTRLADARVQGGEVVEATRLVADAADLAMRYRSPRLVTALQTSRDRMAPWKDTPAVRELDQRLADLGLIVPDHR